MLADDPPHDGIGGGQMAENLRSHAEASLAGPRGAGSEPGLDFIQNPFAFIAIGVRGFLFLFQDGLISPDHAVGVAADDIIAVWPGVNAGFHPDPDTISIPATVKHRIPSGTFF